MSILRGMISPHPPIIVPEVGGEEAKKVSHTAESLQVLTAVVKELAPEVVIVSTPHGTVFRDAVAVTAIPRLNGNLAQFGAGHVDFDYANDLELADEIIRTAVKNGISAVALDHDLAGHYGASVRLDHGITVPLYFLKQAGVSFSLVPVSIGFLPLEELYQFGTCIREAVDKLGRRAVFLASGDLSHRLTPDAPAGFNPRGKEFDTALVEFLKKGDVEGIIRLDDDLVEAAGECGLRPIIMMLGALDGCRLEVNVHSYEGPFGVGYMVADIRPGERGPEKSVIKKIFAQRQEALNQVRAGESEPVALARHTLETYLNTGKIVSPPVELSEILKKQAGVFVSIKKYGQLRGCIGTIEPTQPNVAEEIIHNAISAGTKDPRFDPVTTKELRDLEYSVDILYPPEAVSGMAELDPKRYGVIVRQGYRTGLLLPNLEGIDTAEEQVKIAKRKAGIADNEPIEMERFEVVRYR
ncbi:MAG: AmmeMemoRadiSam system protein A [Bacillota bacterium]|jgi:AmmeMemoRadiSam system protein A/AmmeMemoRadiSam system protein B